MSDKNQFSRWWNARNDGGPQRPDADPPGPEEMLVLGERRPAVEDTTAQALARKAEELERQRAEAEREVERLRELSERELAQMRNQTEKELKRRQREIDHAERQLQRTEQRLRREASRSGQGHLVPRVRPSGSGSSASGSRPARSAGSASPSPTAGTHSGWAWFLAAGAVVFAVLVGWSSSSLSADSDRAQRVVDAGQAYIEWQAAGMELDRDLIRHLEGQPQIEPPGERPSVIRISQAASAYPESVREYDIRQWDNGYASMLQDTSAAKVRSLTSWQNLRERTTYAFSVFTVRRMAEDIGSGTTVTLVQFGFGVAALLSLAVILWRSGRRWPLALLLASAMALAAAAVPAVRAVDDGLGPTAYEHAQLLRWVGAVPEALFEDLDEAFGTSRYPAGDSYWEYGHLDEDESAAAQQYQDSREAVQAALADTTGQSPDWAEAQVTEAAGDLIDAAWVVFDERVEVLDASADDVLSLAQARPDVPQWQPRGLAVLAAALAGSALVLPGRSARKEES